MIQPAAPSPKAPPASGRRRSPGGRLVSYLAFAMVAAWGAISVLGSVAVDLFGKPPTSVTADDPFRDRSWCARRLASLQQELDARATFEAGAELPDPDPTARWQAYVQAWQQSYTDAHGRCAPQGEAMQSAFAQLDAWHRGLSGSIEQLLRTRHDLGRDVSQRAQALLPEP